MIGYLHMSIFYFVECQPPVVKEYGIRVAGTSTSTSFGNNKTKLYLVPAVKKERHTSKKKMWRYFRYDCYSPWKAKTLYLIFNLLELTNVDTTVNCNKNVFLMILFDSSYSTYRTTTYNWYKFNGWVYGTRRLFFPVIFYSFETREKTERNSKTSVMILDWSLFINCHSSNRENTFVALLFATASNNTYILKINKSWLTGLFDSLRPNSWQWPYLYGSEPVLPSLRLFGA